MADNVHELRPGAGGDTKKLTINLGYVDLGHMDLLVQDGFYSNRTDFIRTAIRVPLRHPTPPVISIRQRTNTPGPASVRPGWRRRARRGGGARPPEGKRGSHPEPRGGPHAAL